MKNKIVLITSLLLTLSIILIEYSLNYDFCSSYFCREAAVNIGETFLFFPFIFVFSLITYFAPARVFVAWWAFARVTIPIVFVMSLAINLGLHHDPAGTWQDIYDVPALMLLYMFFSIGSLWQIWRGYRGASLL